MGKDDTKRLVEDEFDEESLSDTDLEKVELHPLKVQRTRFTTFGAVSQVVVFLMFWCIMLGASMICLHIVSQKDPNWHYVMSVGLSITWISLSNLSAILILLADKYLASHGHPRISESLVQCQFILGGVIGGWLGLCFTCYRPVGVAAEKSHSFICRTMITTSVGVAIDVFLILKIIIPFAHMMF